LTPVINPFILQINPYVNPESSGVIKNQMTDQTNISSLKPLKSTLAFDYNASEEEHYYAKIQR